MYKNINIDKLVNNISSPKTDPGGGSTITLISIISLSLGELALNVSNNKLKNSNLNHEYNNIVNKLSITKESLYNFMIEDQNAYNDVVLSKKNNLSVGDIEEANLTASLVPIKISNTLLDLINDLNYIINNCSSIIKSDAIISKLFVVTCIKSLIITSQSNLSNLKDNNNIENIKNKIYDIEKLLKE